jgi:hypothetical protein
MTHQQRRRGIVAGRHERAEDVRACIGLFLRFDAFVPPLRR